MNNLLGYKMRQQITKITCAVAGILISLFVYGCHKPVKQEYFYPNNSKISNAQGIPADSLTYYFPDSIIISDSLIKTGIGHSDQNWYASNLYSAKEPILFNYYTGHNIYRFTWIRSFNLPVIISINRDNNIVWLSTKILDRQPTYMQIKYLHKKNLLYAIKHRARTKEIIDSIVGPYRYAEFKINVRKELSLKEWDEFEQILKTCNYWDMAPVKKEYGNDGAEWIIEAHLTNRYWFVDRWSPRDNIKSCGEYLIKLSGIHEPIY
jgi:hypothetical protein